ncbi:hypothetical protein CS369_04440 [Candidatus Symbiopectobacterium sp. 'North America']|uniref:zinc ribbon-containing protein n=1 Tax=Candidatus Symbiopectobacterium sp. 'North America' TaxID=2794574 RepID=UPI0018CA458F|nr:zinc ribbon-containing protein [Candidatus Symbiopectobacterium sp. 'North America']MBG6244262.1 hypothetical protein [Candidatus Symbiopectobacterium sp. 'North America']
MNKKAQHYRALMSSIMTRLRAGERDLTQMLQHARESLHDSEDLTHREREDIIQSVERDLAEFAQRYTDSKDEDLSDSVFLRVIKESLWQELVDITDKTQLEWQALFKDVSHHGVYHSGEVVGLGNLVCENCHHHLAFYTPEVLPRCPKCEHDQFQRQPFQP